MRILIAKVKHFSIFIFNFYLHYALCLIISFHFVSFCFVFHSVSFSFQFLCFPFFFSTLVFNFLFLFFHSFVSLVFWLFTFFPFFFLKNVALSHKFSSVREMSFVRLLATYTDFVCSVFFIRSSYFHIFTCVFIFSSTHKSCYEVLICLFSAIFPFTLAAYYAHFIIKR